jgi:CheY-like chemotaxis protein
VEPDQLELAVLNLCINARDAMPDGGVVVLSTRNVTMRRDAPEPGGPQSLPDGDYVMISVADSGMGMTADVLRRVFEPFFTTKEIGKGTGLGLSMVYALAEQCGGTAHIDSVPGEGTRVDIYLPRVISPGKPPQGEDRPEAAPIVGRVLVVDDDPEVRAVTSAFIADLGHGLAEANDGASALRALKSEQIDLVVADFAMPGMNGAELATQARISRPDLPVLLVTGYADLGRVPDGYPVLHKPFEQAELAAAIANLLRDARRTG